jgi:hypothetical protein
MGAFAVDTSRAPASAGLSLSVIVHQALWKFDIAAAVLLRLAIRERIA